MHGLHGLPASTQTGLAVFYACVVLLNIGFALYQTRVERNKFQALLWSLVAGFFLIHAAAYAFHAGWMLPQGIKNAIDWFMNPITYFVLSTVAFLAFLYWLKFFTEPVVAWATFWRLLAMLSANCALWMTTDSSRKRSNSW